MFPFPNPSTLFGKPFGDDLDPYLPFSSPIFSSGSHHQLLLPRPCLQTTPLIGNDNLTLAAAADDDPPLMMTRKAPNVGRARGPRKDRHSKIITATGLRDRRIRLSRGVACKFFDLQEKLGVDHGSETVQWLLTMCADAIQQLTSLSATPRLVDNGGQIPRHSFNLDQLAENASSSMASAGVEVESSKNEKQAIINPSGSINPSLMLARESRARARARARERTTEKRRLMCYASSSSGHVGDGGLGSSLSESIGGTMEEGDNAGAGRVGDERCYNQLLVEKDELSAGIVPILDCWIADLHTDMDDDVNWKNKT